MRRTSYQQGSLKLAELEVPMARSSTRWIDSSQEIVIGTFAQTAVDAILLNVNRQTPQQLLKNISVETLVKHYREHELPDIFHKRKPESGSVDEMRKSYSTQYAYEIYLSRSILPRWRSYRLPEVKAVDVEAWLKSLPLARGVADSEQKKM